MIRVKKLKNQKQALCKKTNDLEWGEIQPQDLEKRDWIGSTAYRGAGKMANEAANVSADLRQNTHMWNSS